MKVTDYLRVIKTHADNIVQAGGDMSDRSMISQVLRGLDEEYNPVVAVLQGKSSITWPEIQSELLVFEKHLDYQRSLKTNSFNNASMNVVSNRMSDMNFNSHFSKWTARKLQSRERKRQRFWTIQTFMSSVW